MRNSNQSNKFSKSYHSFAMSSRNSSLLTNISIMINPNSNETFNTFKQNNNNSNAVINRKSILPYLYRNLHEKKLNGKNNKEIYKTYLKLLQQKLNSIDLIQKNSINKNQSEELFLKNIYFNNRNDYNFISNKMRVKFNKYNILKKNKNKLNIKYSLNKNVDGNCLKKNNSELSLALSQDINYSNSDNLLNNKYSKNNKNIFRKKNSLNENIIKKLIQKVRANIVDIKNNNKEKNLLKNANMNIQINSSINNGKTNKMRIILKNKENYFKKKNK
jgi:hypothetical protein